MGEAPRSWLDTRCIDDYRPLRVVVIGAGISGILASIRLPQRIPHLSLQIYEKNADVGGTWFENRYPGCACDIPAHTYQATFEPNHDWSQFYATSQEIHAYWRKVVAKYHCMRHIKLNHQVVKAVWDDRQSKWQVEVGFLSMECVTDKLADWFDRSRMSRTAPCSQTRAMWYSRRPEH